MKQCAWAFAALLFAASAVAADSAAAKDVQAAAKKLAAAPNYTWTSKVEGGFGGSNDGKIEKNGYTLLTFRFRDNESKILIKDGKGAISGDDGWQSTAGADENDFRARFLASMVERFEPPAVQAQKIAEKADVKMDGDAYTCTLSEEAAKDLMSFRGRRGNGNGPEISNAKGSAKFWTKDGMLSKFQYSVSGTMSFNGNDRDIDRTTTVEIKDVGTTKIDVPAEAKAALAK